VGAALAPTAWGAPVVADDTTSPRETARAAGILPDPLVTADRPAWPSRERWASPWDARHRRGEDFEPATRLDGRRTAGPR